MQATPDDGLWKSKSTQDHLCKFIHQFQTEIKDTYQETWKDLNKVI